MRPLHSFIVSAVALAGLLGVPAAHAVDVAKMPLKASVLAKPNVIFGVDDSGSMDSEVLLPTNDGAFWWDFTNKNGWNAGTGKLNFNDAGNANNQWRKMVYLFPNGQSNANGIRAYGDSDFDHFAIMPTAELAFLRSSDYNPLYYNPAITYKHWSPANAAKSPYGDSPTTAARSHPVYGTRTHDLTTLIDSSTDNWVFTALPGMVIPTGAKVRRCNANNAADAANELPCTWDADALTSDVVAGTTVGTTKYTGVTRVSMPYFPATYYVKVKASDPADICNAPSVCYTAPDGAKIKRYEIKSGNDFPSGRSYETELQNFANWFTYYRKRDLMLSAAMGQVLEPLTGLRIGFMRFNSRPDDDTRVKMYDLDDTSWAENGRKVAGLFYETNGSGGTPTRETLQRIGKEYAAADGPIQYACQRNNAFIVTDGFANVSSINPPAYTPKAGEDDAPPYTTTYPKSLANLALGYYRINPRPTMATGRVPKTDVDKNEDLHVNTYGLTIGSRGILFQDDNSPRPTNASDWIDPTQTRHPSAVDDLWHATINGRGQMYLATNPTETTLKVQAAMTDILKAVGAQGGIAVSTVNLSRGDQRAYFGTYDPAGWVGDLAAYPISTSTGVVSTGEANRIWSASALLEARSWTTRQIAASVAGAGVEFTAGAVGTTVNPGSIYGSTDDVVDYLRGKRDLEGTALRKRLGLIGAVINSQPAVDRDNKVAYVQSNEGMLHAFDTTPGTDTGKELWAVVPSSVLPKIGATAQRGYVFRALLDGTPVVASVGGTSKLLVAGAGIAGNSYLAMDVSSPRFGTQAAVASAVKWEFPSAGDATKMGLAVGKPAIVRTKDDGHVVLLTSGYNTGDGKGRLWMVKPGDGSVIHEFEVPSDGLAQVSVYGEPDGSARYVYAGDLDGKVWRFDLKAKDAAFKLATLKDADGNPQPVTAAPELALIEGKRVVVVGTGRILGVSDLGNTKVQSIYVMIDGGVFMDNARTVLTKQLFDRSSNTATVTAIDWTDAATTGWYLDMAAGEQINTRPSLAFGTLAWVTNVIGKEDCSATSYLYLADLKSGEASASTISLLANSSGVTLLRTDGSNGKEPSVVPSGQNFNGEPWTKDPIPLKKVSAAKNAWRDIRR